MNSNNMPSQLIKFYISDAPATNGAFTITNNFNTHQFHAAKKDMILSFQLILSLAGYVLEPNEYLVIHANNVLPKNSFGNYEFDSLP